MTTQPGPSTTKKASPGYRTSGRPITDDAPKDVRPSAPPRDTPNVPADRPGKIAKWVTTQYTRIGILLTPVDPVCGNAVTSAAVAAGLAWERLARENKTIRDVINRLMQTTVTTELIMAHLPIMIAVLTHHVPAFRDLVAKSSMAFLADFSSVNVSTPEADAA